ncbi:MAG: cysteine dioxygenase family protein [Planctomycetota bacterium]
MPAPSGNVSSIHNHRDQQCWMLVAQGQLMNQNYLVHDRDPARGTCRLEESSSLMITPEAPMAVDPEEPVHQVRNLREFGGPAVSVHIYANPFDTCEVYCPDKGIYRDVKLSYWSKFGRLVHQQNDPCADD